MLVWHGVAVVCVQAVVEREQTCEELHNLQRRFEDSVAETQQRIAQECETVRREEQLARQTLQHRVPSACLLTYRLSVGI